MTSFLEQLVERINQQEQPEIFVRNLLDNWVEIQEVGQRPRRPQVTSRENLQKIYYALRGWED